MSLTPNQDNRNPNPKKGPEFDSQPKQRRCKS